jgi:hypothetical protein
MRLIFDQSERRQRILCLIGVFVIGLMTFAAFSGSSIAADKGAGNKTYFTAYNLWYETGKEKAMWTINYKTGNIIPAGTEITDLKVDKSEIIFTTVGDQKKYAVNFNPKFHPGKSTEDYSKMMFSDKDFSRLTQGMSQSEIDGIKEGVIKVGMSKNAVIVAYGYPPEHKTPDTTSNVWLYWMNRFVSKAINFDADGKTIKPPSDQL